MFGFVDETQENVVDLFSYEGAEAQEFSVNTMKHSFQKVTFTRIFRVEQFQQLKRGENETGLVGAAWTRQLRSRLRVDAEEFVSKATESISY